MSQSALPPELDPRGQRRAPRYRSARGNVIKPIAMTLGALLSVALLLVAGYSWLTFRNINNGLDRPNITALNQPPQHVQHHAQFNGKDQNILLVG